MMETNVNTVEFAKALADDTRQKIMALCCCQELSVNDIVEATGVSQPTVSHHLKILKSAGLVYATRRGQQVIYSLNQKQVALACCQVAESFAPDLDLNIIES